MLIWPGREVITYGGHAIVLGETPDVIEYRVGYEGTTLGEIQQADERRWRHLRPRPPDDLPGPMCSARSAGAASPRTRSTGHVELRSIEAVPRDSIAGRRARRCPNPFVRTAVEQWEGNLAEGYRLTAVSGSDDKAGDSYGEDRDEVYAEQLSGRR